MRGTPGCRARTVSAGSYRRTTTLFRRVNRLPGCAGREWLSIADTIWSDCRADDAELALLLDQAGKAVTFTR